MKKIAMLPNAYASSSPGPAACMARAEPRNRPDADRPADGDHLDVPVLQPAMEILFFVKLLFPQ